jgi:hypothetical protein
MKRVIYFIIFSFVLFTSLVAANRKVVIDSVKIQEEYLIVDFRVEGIIDDKIAEGLRKGRTSTLEYKIQLWGNKAGVFNQIVQERYIRMKVFYDFWENKYVILSPQEKRLTSSIETVKEKCTEITSYRIMPVKNLQSDLKYRIFIEIILRPLSVENYQEIKSWLNGEVKNINLKEIAKPEKQAKGFGSRILKMFMAITGFGDRILSTKSEKFKIINNQISWQ